MQHINVKTIKNVFRTKYNIKTCILSMKFDFAMPNENTYNCVDIFGYRPSPDLVTIFSQPKP